MKAYYLFRLAFWLSKVVPARVAYWFCSLAEGLVFSMSSWIWRAVMDNLRHVLPDASERARRTLGRRVVRNVLKNYYDLVRLPHMKPQDLERTITLRGIGHLEHASAQGRGV